MNIIAIGCEYTGTTTLMLRLQEWMVDAFGQTTIFHDHFKLPNHSGHPPLDPDIIIFDEEEKRQILEMSPKLKELFSRYTLYYHSPTRARDSKTLGGLHIGHHIDEMIYAPMYFGYGRPGEPGDRRVEAQCVEQGLAKYMPETVLVLMRASADVVRSRMGDAPHRGRGRAGRGHRGCTGAVRRGVHAVGDPEQVHARHDRVNAGRDLRGVSLQDGAVLDGGRPSADADARGVRGEETAS